jgi:hypothetical protein
MIPRMAADIRADAKGPEKYLLVDDDSTLDLSQVCSD